MPMYVDNPDSREDYYQQLRREYTDLAVEEEFDRLWKLGVPGPEIRRRLATFNPATKLDVNGIIAGDSR